MSLRGESDTCIALPMPCCLFLLLGFCTVKWVSVVLKFVGSRKVPGALLESIVPTLTLKVWPRYMAIIGAFWEPGLPLFRR